MIRIGLILGLIYLSLGWNQSRGFSIIPSRSSFHGRDAAIERRSQITRSTISMRDRSSSYWFSPGDRVEVMEEVIKAGCNLKGRVGIVAESWEKCDVDPTCCCAEQVERDLAVRVKFPGTEWNENEEGSFEFGFNEDELRKATAEEYILFDGKTCKAFKLELLDAQRNAVSKLTKLQD